MNKRRWGCLGALIAVGILPIIGVVSVVWSTQRIAASVEPQLGFGATISWQPAGRAVTAYAERLRFWPPQQLQYQDRINFPDWPMDEPLVPGQRIRLHDVAAKAGDCYRLVEGYAEVVKVQTDPSGKREQINFHYQQAGIVCWFSS